MATLTLSKRLNGLLPWINGDRLTDDEIRHRLIRFLQDFRAKNLRTMPDAGLREAHRATAGELKAVHRKLLIFVFADAVDSLNKGDDYYPFKLEDLCLLLNTPSLRFGLLRHPRKGDFELLVEAKRLRDLVPFLVTYALTTGEIVLARCPARAPGSTAHCDRFFITGGVGRPRVVCSGACRTRRFSEALEKRSARRKKFTRRRHDVDSPLNRLGWERDMQR